MKQENLNLLAWDVPKTQTQPVREALSPFLIYHKEIKSFLPNGPHNRLLLHPRIQEVEHLPANVIQLCQSHGSQHTPYQLDGVPPTVIEQLWTVVFFSKSKASPPLTNRLPDNWQQVLSNFYPTQIEIEGATYATVEHYFQGQKALASTKPEMADWFSADNDGPNSIDSDSAAAKKAGSRKAYQQHGAMLDMALWETQRVAAMQTALNNRYFQDVLFQKVLNSPKGMKLLQFERSGARSFWGGNFSKKTGEAVGENMLGQLLMQIRDQGAS
ncbi:MAG: NADAR family protein [Chloroflexota bacterium]